MKDCIGLCCWNHLITNAHIGLNKKNIKMISYGILTYSKLFSQANHIYNALLYRMLFFVLPFYYIFIFTIHYSNLMLYLLLWIISTVNNIFLSKGKQTWRDFPHAVKITLSCQESIWLTHFSFLTQTESKKNIP